MDKIPLSEPIISHEDHKAVENCLKSGWVAIRGKKSQDFCRKLLEIKRFPHGLCLNNGTNALVLSLLAIKLPKDSIIAIPDRSFIATASAVILAGHRPIFYQIKQLDLQPDLNSIRAAIQSGARACIAVHLFGYPFDEKPLQNLCQEKAIPLIFDSAESLGSSFDNLAAGRSGRFSALSFNGNKIITCGGGGFLACESPEDFEKIKSLSDHGINSKTGEIDGFGGNFLMTDLLASLGLSQLSKLKQNLKKKAEIRQVYFQELSPHGYEFIEESKLSTPNYWLSIVGHPKAKELCLKLNKEGISARPFFPKISQFKYFSGFSKANIPKNDGFDHFFALPSSVNLAMKDQERVIKALKDQ